MIQRIFYVHVPAAVDDVPGVRNRGARKRRVSLAAHDERADAAAVAAGEGGLIFGAIMLTSGPLWGRVAWGTYWTWGAAADTHAACCVFTYLGVLPDQGAPWPTRDAESASRRSLRSWAR